VKIFLSVIDARLWGFGVARWAGRLLTSNRKLD
jgi:hypothetical protein